MGLMHLRPMLAHVPVLAATFDRAPLVLSFALKGSRLADLASRVHAAAAIFAIPTHSIEESAKEALGELPSVVKGAIERHPEMTPLSLISVGVVPSGMMSCTALLRGGVQHTEIRAGAGPGAGADGGRQRE